MSFGAAAARGRTLPEDARCPCGGGAFGACCGPILAGATAPTAERLMRSRFTAFAVGDAAHLRATWHPATAPDRLDLDDELRWERLDVIGTTGGEPGAARGTVEFRAHWRSNDGRQAGELHETSRFRTIAGRWLYVDGDVDPDGA